jgi:hypothetical protein
MASSGALAAVCLLLTGCKPMGYEKSLSGIRNSSIQLATSRPPGARMAVLERRVSVTGPPEAVELARSGDPAVLDALLPLLKDPERDWAAEVVLSAMTGREGKDVDTYQTQPEQWRQTLGAGAYDRWSRWLNSVRGHLAWDPAQQMFTEKP